VREYIKDHKKEYGGNGAPPDEECEEDDFEDYEPEVKIKSPSDGSDLGSSFTIEVGSDSPFDIKEIKLYVNGDEKKSSSDSSFSYTYDASDKNGENISIEAKIEDEKGQTDSDKISVHISF
jgi:hypothetical protein